jgi:hypothetical protein
MPYPFGGELTVIPLARRSCWVTYTWKVPRVTVTSVPLEEDLSREAE